MCNSGSYVLFTWSLLVAHILTLALFHMPDGFERTKDLLSIKKEKNISIYKTVFNVAVPSVLHTLYNDGTWI